jgi:hypothetical protein
MHSFMRSLKPSLSPGWDKIVCPCLLDLFVGRGPLPQDFGTELPATELLRPASADRLYPRDVIIAERRRTE